MKQETEQIISPTAVEGAHNPQEEVVELVLMGLVIGFQPQMEVTVLLVTEDTVITLEKEPVAAAVADIMEVAVALLVEAGAGAAVAVEVAIHIQHFVVQLSILKERNLLV